jgi:predicted dehydrogenase
VTVVKPDGAPIVHSFEGFDRNQMFVDELRHFLTCIENRSRPIVDLRDGAQSLRMALAVKQSIASRTVVDLRQ